MHYIFQRTGMTPDVVLQMPRYLRTFLLKSMEVQIEEENEQRAASARQQGEAIKALAGRRRR